MGLSAVLITRMGYGIECVGWYGGVMSERVGMMLAWLATGILAKDDCSKDL